ncbi:hypothetical protein E1301_Tti001835 [Triplophysa tibetana]|uniref:Uncharacterized protein n=1 Tax=Triplophysa tibetana TaxID=1572043 RepID=A0A5A9PBM6_9TELE|nr:hypothetical protein E1301_Tti001835 [Triplophysa tibetana]
MLLQGTELPKQLYLAKESLPEARTLPDAPALHRHEAMVFEEPANQEGEAFIRKRVYPPDLPVPYSNQCMPNPQFQTPSQFRPPPQFQAPDNLPPQTCPSTQPRQRTWRRQKAAQEDEERVARGEPPRKRLAKDIYHYVCKQCGLAKNKTTGHTQLKGRWYCPASGLSIAQWREDVQGL